MSFEHPEQDQTINPTGNDTSEIRTLFLTGLPDDIKEREIHNLFRFVPGYEGCRLSTVNSRPVSFAVFHSRESASNAIQQFNGIKFDPDFEHYLGVDFARANSEKIKRLISDPSQPQQAEKRRKMAIQSNTTPQYQYGSFPSDNYSFGTYGYTDTFGQSQMQLPLSQTQSLYSQSLYPQSLYSQSPYPSNHTRNPPCTTLFVTGLDPTLGANELRAILSTGPGFLKFKMGKDNTHCFIDYSDLHSSGSAVNTLNGLQLGGSKLRADYAKNKMTSVAEGSDGTVRQSF